MQDFGFPLLVSGFDSQPRPILCVVFAANGWINSRIK